MGVAIENQCKAKTEPDCFLIRFLVLAGINEPSAWKTFDRKSRFWLLLRSPQANDEKIVIYRIEAFCERTFTIRETFTSLVRGQAK